MAANETLQGLNANAGVVNINDSTKAVQIGSGTNTEGTSVQVGSGIRICSTPPLVPKNGDIWVDSQGFICFFTNGSIVQIGT